MYGTNFPQSIDPNLVRFFRNPGNGQGITRQIYRVPRGAKFLFASLRGGAGGGGGGFTKAVGAAGGGGGGGAAGPIINCLIPTILIPEFIYVSPGYGGNGGIAGSAGSGGSGTGLYLGGGQVANEGLIVSGGGGGGGAGTATAAGAGATWGANNSDRFGFFLVKTDFGGINGSAGGTHNGTAGGSPNATNIGAFAGAGGGGSLSAAFNGGSVAALHPFFPATLSGGIAGGLLDGLDGETIFKNKFTPISRSGSGGASTNTAGQTGGRGGNGGLGSGGGGGGAGVVAGGAGGKGGDGWAVIVAIM